MKKIEAIIRKSKFVEVKEALHKWKLTSLAIGTLLELETKWKFMCIE